jgi:hypothetical protein
MKLTVLTPSLWSQFFDRKTHFDFTWYFDFDPKYYWEGISICILGYGLWVQIKREIERV